MAPSVSRAAGRTAAASAIGARSARPPSVTRTSAATSIRAVCGTGAASSVYHSEVFYNVALIFTLLLFFALGGRT